MVLIDSLLALIYPLPGDNVLNMQQKSYPLRMPDEMREQLQALADESGRSLNAEIIARLEPSLLDQSEDVLLPAEKARMLADASKEKLPNNILRVVSSQIRHAVSLGRTSAFLDIRDFELDSMDDDSYEEISEAVIQKLKGLGYEAKFEDGVTIYVSF